MLLTGKAEERTRLWSFLAFENENQFDEILAFFLANDVEFSVKYPSGYKIFEIDHQDFSAGKVLLYVRDQSAGKTSSHVLPMRDFHDGYRYGS